MNENLELLKALKTIQDYCSHEDCGHCPMRWGGVSHSQRGDRIKCYLSVLPPHQWHLALDTENWQAFE